MKTISIILSLMLVVVMGDRLEPSYLPPLNTKGADGASFLTPPLPNDPTGFSENRVTSYAAPASGPVPSAFYNTPSIRSFSRIGQDTVAAPVATLYFNNDNFGDGSYRFQYETENHIRQEESGKTKSLGKGNISKVVQGSYSFTAPDGVTYTVNYIADENGFRASGDHLPTPPPVPAQRSLEGKPTHSSYSDTAMLRNFLPSREYLAPYPEPGNTPGYL